MCRCSVSVLCLKIDFSNLKTLYLLHFYFNLSTSGIFYLSIIVIIFIGTLFSAFILNVHLQKTRNKPIPPLVSYVFFHKIAPWLGVRPPTALLELWIETGVRIRGVSFKIDFD